MAGASMKGGQRLFDLLADTPAGMVIDEIAEHLGIGVSAAYAAVRGLRLLLGDTDTITLIADPPEGYGGPWTYRLVGNLDEARLWVANRISDVETRLVTITSVVAPLTAGDARDPSTRKARLIHRSLTRLQEDLADVEV